jgi:hypothetical protein
MSAERRTCGRGLAEHAALPAKLAELTAALAENLEVHMQALDLGDAAAAQEHRAYASLAERHRSLAAQLRATGEEMAGYRELPMGRHDEHAMASPEAGAAFERFLRVQRELVAVLEESVRRDQELLGSS